MANFDDYRSLYDKGLYQEAYAVLRDIVKSQPLWSRDGDMYVWYVDLEILANDDIGRARQFLEKANKLGCSDMVNYYRLHEYVLWRIGEEERGMQELEKSVALDSRVSNLSTLGFALSCMDDKRAFGVWQQVLEKDPDNCSAHIYIGEELAKSGNRGKALLMAKRAEKLNPSVDDVFEIGRLYQKVEQFQSALNAYQEANRLGYADKALIYACIAVCYLSFGDESATRKYAEWAMQCDPENDYVKEVWKTYEERFCR